MQSIDQFFKEKSNALELPNSQLDAQWQQAAKQLAAKNKIAKAKKIVMFSGVAAVVIGVSIVFWPSAKNSTVVQANSQALTNETVPKAVKISADKAIKPSSIISTKAPTASQENKPATSTTVIPAPQAITLNKQTNFYVDLSKEPEVFTVKPNESAEFTTKAGATIKIPAAALSNTDQNAALTLTVQEYYDKKGNAAMVKYHFYQNEKLVKTINEKQITVTLPNTIGNGTEVVFYNQDDNIKDELMEQIQFVSTEKFMTNSNSKINYKITLPAEYNAATFTSILAFAKDKVAIPGDVVGNSISFKNIPKGEEVYFISIGKANSRYFICNKKLLTTSNEITDLHFLEISELYYSKKLSEIATLNENK